MNYETLKQANYSYVKQIEKGLHVLKNNETKIKELFQCSRFFAGWAIKYKNTHLEYCRDLKTSELIAHGIYNA